MLGRSLGRTQTPLSFMLSTRFARNAGNMSGLRQLFDDLTDANKLAPELKLNIPNRCKVMTRVQAATFDSILDAKDVFVHSMPRTGKTLAFLVPTIQQLITRPPDPRKISIVIIAPTRDLALQITQDAKTLVKGTDLRVRCVVGGRAMDNDQSTLGYKRCDILIATPGRFVGHVKKSALAEKLTDIRTLILDEADILLDAPLRPQLRDIIRAMPDRSVDRNRQTLLFTSTVTKQTKKVPASILRPQYEIISTVPPQTSPTRAGVTQEYITCSHADIYPETLRYISSHLGVTANVNDRSIKNQPDTKIIVYCSTTGAAEVTYRMLKKSQVGIPVFEVHSRMDHRERTVAAQSFREAHSGVLVASDILSPGVNFPGTRVVIQLGMPLSPEQYINRLGQVPNNGSSLLLLSSYEEQSFFAQPGIRALSLVKISKPIALFGEGIEQWREKAMRGASKVSRTIKIKAYQAWLGFYYNQQRLFGWGPEQLVNIANSYARDVLRYDSKGEMKGWVPPPISVKTVRKLGIEGVDGLNVIEEVNVEATLNVKPL